MNDIVVGVLCAVVAVRLVCKFCFSYLTAISLDFICIVQE